MTGVNDRLFQIVLVLVCFIFVLSCDNKNNQSEDVTEKSKVFLYEGSGESGFQMLISLYPNNTAKVLSGCPRYDSDSQLIDGTADVENLTWSKTVDGFILKDAAASSLYTAVVRREFGRRVRNALRRYHQLVPFSRRLLGNLCRRKGWKREVNLNLWINLWGDDL